MNQSLEDAAWFVNTFSPETKVTGLSSTMENVPASGSQMQACDLFGQCAIASAAGVYHLELTPASPAIAINTDTDIVARVTPAQGGITVNFTVRSGLSTLSTVTDGSGEARVTFTAGGSPSVETIEATIDSTVVTDTAIVHVGALSNPVVQDRASSNPQSIGDLITHNVNAVKHGSGTPWLGIAKLGGNPCISSSRTVSPMGDFVDVLLEDAFGVDSLVVTVGYTSTSGTPALFWCDANGDWQLASPGSVDAGNKTVSLTVTGATTPTLNQLEGTPFVVADSTPLSVTLGWFLAERNGDNVDIQRQTLAEHGVAGFHVLAVTEGGNIQLNGDLIPSPVIDSSTPVDYQFSVNTDATRFLLQEVAVDGHVTEYGPFELGQPHGARVEPGGTEVAPRIWLPMVTR